MKLKFPPKEKTFTNMPLKDLSGKSLYSTVSVRAKVINVAEVSKLANGLCKQTITIADETAAAHLVLWEDDVNTVEECESYFFQGLGVRIYKHEKYLTKPKEGANIEIIEDIGEVANDDLAIQSTTLEGVEIVGVANLQAFKSCIACSAKVEEQDDKLAKCSKCDMIQALDRCKSKMSGRIVVKHGDQCSTLSAFDEILSTIAQSKHVTPQSLLYKQVDITYIIVTILYPQFQSTRLFLNKSCNFKHFIDM